MHVAHPILTRSGPILMVWLSLGCTLAPTVNVPTGDLKEAAQDVSSGVEGAAKEFGKGIGESGEKYRNEIQAVSKDLHALTQSVQDAMAMAKGSPAAFGEAVTDHLFKEEAVQRALKSVSQMAQSGERVAASAETGPTILAQKLEHLQAELTKGDGFITQHRTALVEELRKERIALTDLLHQERAAATRDLEALTIKVIDEVAAQVRKLVEGALWLLILFVAVLWGLPFGAGFLVGRLVRKKDS